MCPWGLYITFLIVKHFLRNQVNSKQKLTYQLFNIHWITYRKCLDSFFITYITETYDERHYNGHLSLSHKQTIKWRMGKVLVTCHEKKWRDYTWLSWQTAIQVIKLYKTLRIEFLRSGYPLFIFTVFIQIDFEENMILYHAKRTVKTFWQINVRTFDPAFCALFLDRSSFSKILHYISFSLVN